MEVNHHSRPKLAFLAALVVLLTWAATVAKCQTPAEALAILQRAAPDLNRTGIAGLPVYVWSEQPRPTVVVIVNAAPAVPQAPPRRFAPGELPWTPITPSYRGPFVHHAPYPTVIVRRER